MKKFWKIMLIIVLVPVLLLGGCYYLLVGTSERVYTNLNNYEKDLQAIENAANFMPSLDSLTGYKNIEYTYKVTCYSHLVGFYSDAYSDQPMAEIADNAYMVGKGGTISPWVFR